MKRHPTYHQALDELRAVRDSIIAAGGAVPPQIMQHPNVYQMRRLLHDYRDRLLVLGASIPELKRNPNISQFRAALVHVATAAEYVVANPIEDGDEGYVAYAIKFDGATSFTRGAALTGVSDSPKGFYSFWINPTGNDSLIEICTVQTTYNVYMYIQSNGFVSVDFRDEASDNHFSWTSTDPTVQSEEWNHVLIAWDMDFPYHQRRLAIYVNDAITTLSEDAESDDPGQPFSLDWTDTDVHLLSTVDDENESNFADVGLWIGTTLVGADLTISEVNRRKFIDADGKPVDPVNWPASPVCKFVGDASAFATNQGSGGAFALSGGSLSNAASSPSD